LANIKGGQISDSDRSIRSVPIACERSTTCEGAAVSDVQSPTITEILSLAIALSGVAFSAISVSDGSGTSTESVFGIDRKAVLPCGLKEYLSSIQQQAVVVPNELIDNSLKADYYTEATNRIRFFAGCPIALPDGITFGKLCGT
jgi:GAF domain-containing protein